MRQHALTGLQRYQRAPRQSISHPPPTYIAGERAALLHLSGANDAHKNPVVLIPSLVNPPYILDLSARQSFAGYLTQAGHDVWMVDWGSPSPQDAGLDLAGHVEQLLLPLLRELGAPPTLIGYCLGGTMALAAAAAMPVRAVATLAAPWHFDAYPDAERADIGAIWSSYGMICASLGYAPMEVLQSGFWNLDPHRTIAKYANFARLPEDSDDARAFVALEDWANEGEPLTYGAARDIFERFYRDNVTGQGHWSVAGEHVNPAALSCPTLSIRSTTDRIVPAPACVVLAENIDMALGHVGMIVSRAAPQRVWAPVADWLARLPPA